MGGLVTGLISALVVAVSIISDYCFGLQNVTLIISPPVVQRGRNVTLSCRYDLGNSTLYAVKWYRGQYEFCRYNPSELPKMKIFLFPAIKVDISKSNSSQVVLSEVGFNLSGNITCEVTTEGPGFSTASAVKELAVIDLPKNGPVISTHRARYDPGDRLAANCSSSPSKPHAVLSFYVNNVQLDKMKSEVQPGPDSLFWSFLAVNLTLLPSHFDTQSQSLKLTCIAVIDPVYRNLTSKSLPYRNEPVPEKGKLLTSRSMTSSGIYGLLPLSTMILLIFHPIFISYYIFNIR